MKVKYLPPTELAYGNIVWKGSKAYAMAQGIFPPNHPCAPGKAYKPGSDQCGDSKALQKFRARGYYASCFPEGDGIAIKLKGSQRPERVASDITECFGWEVG